MMIFLCQHAITSKKNLLIIFFYLTIMRFIGIHFGHFSSIKEIILSETKIIYDFKNEPECHRK